MTPQQVILIRREWDAGRINVRFFADALKVSPETIRKVGRRDTYRNIPEEQAGNARQDTAQQPASLSPAPSAEASPEALAASARRIAELQRSTADGMVGELIGNPLDE